MDEKQNGYQLSQHIASKIKVNQQRLSILKNENTVESL